MERDTTKIFPPGASPGAFSHQQFQTVNFSAKQQSIRLYDEWPQFDPRLLLPLFSRRALSAKTLTPGGARGEHAAH